MTTPFPPPPPLREFATLTQESSGVDPDAGVPVRRVSLSLTNTSSIEELSHIPEDTIILPQEETDLSISSNIVDDTGRSVSKEVTRVQPGMMSKSEDSEKRVSFGLDSDQELRRRPKMNRSKTSIRKTVNEDVNSKLRNISTDIAHEIKDRLGELLADVVMKLRGLALPVELSELRLVVHQNGAWIEQEENKDKMTNDRISSLEADLKCEVREQCPCICCWDEEDDGLPPFCRTNEDFRTTIGIPMCRCLSKNDDEPPVAWWKLLNGEHPLLNKNAVCWLFGTIGFRIFDRRRKTFMAVAMWSTLISISFTIYGVAAFSTRPPIVKATYWAWVAVTNSTDGTITKAHMGLNSMLLEHDPCTVLRCQQENLYYGEAARWGKDAGSFTDFYRVEYKECRETASNEIFGLVLTCCALGFALLGASNRMRYKADFHVQKALGVVTDSIGSVSLCVALFRFGFTCWYYIPEEKGELIIETHLGPGFYCYVVCFFGALMRAIFHWVTPTPKKWIEDAHPCSGGCCGGLNEMMIPEEVKQVLDHDEDGTISCSDVVWFLTHLHEDILPQMFSFSDAPLCRRV